MTHPTRAVLPAVYLLLMLCGGRAAAHIEEVLACYVYVEPYEVRVEFVTTTSSLGMPLNYGFDGIDTAEQKSLSEEAGRRIAEAFEVHADGTLLRFEPEQIGFVRAEAEDAPVIPDDRELIPIDEARISGIFVCQRDALPRTIDVRLTLFEKKPYRPPAYIPVEIEVLTSPTNRETAKFEFSEDRPDRFWVLPPSIVTRELAKTQGPPPPSYTLLYIAGALGVVGLVICMTPLGQNRPRRVAGAIVFIAGVAVGAVSLQRGYATPIEQEQATSTIQALLSNVYNAFARRDESKIFDTLATSVDGPLLEELYLDIQRGLSDAEGGGPSVRVIGVELLECEVEESNSGRLHARVRWVSSGTVSHWGHAHERRNQYRAEVTAEPIDGSWRLTEVEILEEERVE